MIQIANRTYEVVVDHKNGWKPEAFRERYSEVLERYDFIVGDWGYNQLRLRGFFKDNHPKATKDSSIATLQDYLNEYCNFGCAYFIIEKVPSKQQNPNQPQESGVTLDLDEVQQAPSEPLAEAESSHKLQQEQGPQREAQQSHQAQQQHSPNQQQHHRRSHHNNQNGQSGQRHHRNQHHKQAQQQRQAQHKEQQGQLKEQQPQLKEQQVKQ